MYLKAQTVQEIAHLAELRHVVLDTVMLFACTTAGKKIYTVQSVTNCHNYDVLVKTQVLRKPSQLTNVQAAILLTELTKLTGLSTCLTRVASARRTPGKPAATAWAQYVGEGSMAQVVNK